MISSSLKNSILSLTLSALIAGVESQATTCTSTSPDCCWVVRIRQLMDKTTSVTPNSRRETDTSRRERDTSRRERDTSRTACCSMEGVTCSGPFVTKIDWEKKDLVGSIPREIGNLKNLTKLDLGYNKLSGPIPQEIGLLTKLEELLLDKNDLSGPIPAEIGNLPRLTELSVKDNESLYGTFSSKKCGIEVSVKNTDVIICGCANEKSPVGYFPSSKTPIECSASEVSGGITTVTKRAPVLSIANSGFLFTCNTNSTTLRPYQDCINLIGAYCLTTTPVFTSWNDCHTKVLSVRDKLNSNWKSYIKSCARFITGGDPTSQRCNDATNQILTNEYYVMSDGTNVNVPLSVVRGAAYIWST